MSDEVTEVYADGIANIGLVGNMVRCELASLSMQHKDEKGNPTLVPKVRVLMSPQAFLQTFGMYQNLIDKLQESGVLTKNEAAGGGKGDKGKKK